MKVHKQMYYFKSSEVLPTIKDVNFHGHVLVWDGVTWKNEDYYRAMDYSHWMQHPKDPDEKDTDF